MGNSRLSDDTARGDARVSGLGVSGAGRWPRWGGRVALLVGLILATPGLQAGLIVVNSTVDGDQADGFVTLREALLIANGSRGVFSAQDPDIPDEAPHVNEPVGAGIADTISVRVDSGSVITLNEALPPLNDSPDSLQTQSGSVIVDGSGLQGTSNVGLSLASSGHVIRGVTFQGFSGGGLVITGANNSLEEIHVVDCLRGMTLTGQGATNNTLFECIIKDNTEDGLRLIDGANLNRIDNCFIYNNGGNGVIFAEAMTTQNMLIQTSIGIMEPVAGQSAAGNGGYGVILRAGANNNRLGNPEEDDDFTFISNNALGGILIEGNGTDNNLLHSMFIGTDIADPTWVGNGTGHGIVVRDGAKNNAIGKFSMQAAIVIGGHQGNAVLITDPGTDGNNIQRMFIGSPNPQAGFPLPNAGHGIEIANGVQNMFIAGEVELSQVEIDHAGGHGLYLNGNNGETPIRNITVGVYHFGDDRVNFPETPSIGMNTIHIEGNVKEVVLGQPDHPNTTTGAAGWGVYLSGPEVENVKMYHVVAGHRGGDRIPNNLGGIYIGDGAHDIEIGGDSFRETCFISGNGDPNDPASEAPGIFIDASGEAPFNINIHNTEIGPGIFADMMPNEGSGILIKDDSATTPKPLTGIMIGKNEPTDPESDRRNTISANKKHGIELVNVAGVTIVDNKIGVTPGGISPMPNEEDGILVDRCEDITIGAPPDEASIDLVSGNVIGGNMKAGIRVRNGSHNLRIHHNLIGMGRQTGFDVGNMEAGVVVEAPGPEEGRSLIIGGLNKKLSGEDRSHHFEGNVISGNNGPGVLLAAEEGGEEIRRVIIQGNQIGTTRVGTAPKGNDAPGIKIEGAGVKDVVIGDWDERGRGNVISGNETHGVEIDGANGWKIWNNLIGLDVDGEEAVANKEHGVKLSNTTEGMLGTNEEPHAGNTISGNDMAGVMISNDVVENVVISHNVIGASPFGRQAVPNEDGIRVEAPLGEGGRRLVIGGRNTGNVNGIAPDLLQAGNLISGNTRDGIRVEAPGGQGDPSIFGLDIFGNQIGIQETTVNPLGNGSAGIRISGGAVEEVIIGSSDDEAMRNVIAGNTEDGIVIEEGASRIEIHRNRIGSSPSGINELPNGRHGIWIKDGATRNLVERNDIWFNTENGVRISGASTERNKLTNNSIHRNLKDGIVLEGGANGGIQPPALDRLFTPGRSTTSIDGHTIANGDVEYFTDTVFNDPGYWGQGRYTNVEYNASLTADANGDFTIDLGRVSPEGIITATVTDSQDNTSAFSPFMDARVIQTIHDDNDLLVANKPTIVRLFADVGTEPFGKRVSGMLDLGGAMIGSLTADFAMEPFGYYDTDGRKGLRKRGMNSLNFYVENQPPGVAQTECILTHNGEERGKLDLDELNFQATQNIVMMLVFVAAPNSIGGTPFVPDGVALVEGAEFFASIYPIDPKQFMRDLFVSAHPLVVFFPSHGALTHGDLKRGDARLRGGRRQREGATQFR